MADGWKLHNELAEITGYRWVIDIIDYFSKFMGSFPITENNAENALISIKEFCSFVGYPKILQTENGLEYANNKIEDFCTDNNIIHIRSRPHHPQTNGVVEVVHKEIRKYVLIEFAKCSKDFNLKNVLLDAVNTHNHNVHSTTGFKPIDIINNTDENIKDQVLDNIEKALKIKHKYDDIGIGRHILINKQVHKKGKRLVLAKFNKKNRLFKLAATVLENYGGGLLAIRLDESNYELYKNEELIIESKLCSLISDEEWNKILKDADDNSRAKRKMGKMVKNKKRKKQ